MKKLLAALPLILAGAVLAPAPAAQADGDRRCSGTIRAVSVDDNIVVPKGKTCRLLGTRVDGDVKINRNGTLIARGVKIDGNIQSSAHKRVVVKPRGNTKSRIEGNIQLKNGGGGQILRTVVDGDIQLFSNKRGRFVVRGNTVDGNLQCKSNKSRPKGGNNRVEGNKENQCSRL